MAKGIIYVMTTVVPGLIKIGKTTRDNFNSRMKFLERNGYNNVTGLKRQFAIEVEDYDEKEVLLHTIFEKSRLKDSELFALDFNMVIQLFASLEGEQVFPKDKNKEKIFDIATQNYNESIDNKRAVVPDEKQLNYYTLADEIDLTGKKIVRYSYKTIEHPVKEWIKMFEDVIRLLHSENKSVLNRLAYETDKSVDLAQYVSFKNEDLRKWIEIDKGIYVERNTSTQLKLSILKRLFELYQQDPNNLIFYLKNEDDTDKDER
ncbi:MAG: GIY-YIG nuclease family protein [Eubacteriaceae bacterium]|nr:GIY-YIG nuclease family protein [Eubacteriaceae bacterium]